MLRGEGDGRNGVWQHRSSIWGDENVLKVTWWQLHIAVTTLKSMNCTWNGWILYVNGGVFKKKPLGFWLDCFGIYRSIWRKRIFTILIFPIHENYAALHLLGSSSVSLINSIRTSVHILLHLFPDIWYFDAIYIVA